MLFPHRVRLSCIGSQVSSLSFGLQANSAWPLWEPCSGPFRAFWKQWTRRQNRGEVSMQGQGPGGHRHHSETEQQMQIVAGKGEEWDKYDDRVMIIPKKTHYTHQCVCLWPTVQLQRLGRPVGLGSVPNVSTRSHCSVSASLALWPTGPVCCGSDNTVAMIYKVCCSLVQILKKKKQSRHSFLLMWYVNVNIYQHFTLGIFSRDSEPSHPLLAGDTCWSND